MGVKGAYVPWVSDALIDSGMLGREVNASHFFFQSVVLLAWLRAGRTLSARTEMEPREIMVFLAVGKYIHAADL